MDAADAVVAAAGAEMGRARTTVSLRTRWARYMPDTAFVVTVHDADTASCRSQ